MNVLIEGNELKSCEQIRFVFLSLEVNFFYDPVPMYIHAILTYTLQVQIMIFRNFYNKIKLLYIAVGFFYFKIYFERFKI